MIFAGRVFFLVFLGLFYLLAQREQAWGKYISALSLAMVAIVSSTTVLFPVGIETLVLIYSALLSTYCLLEVAVFQPFLNIQRSKWYQLLMIFGLLGFTILGLISIWGYFPN